MKIYEVTFRCSPNTKGNLREIAEVMAKVGNFKKFGVSQMSEGLPSSLGVRLRLTSDQFVKFFILRRASSICSYLKWDDVQEVQLDREYRQLFYDITDV